MAKASTTFSPPLSSANESAEGRVTVNILQASERCGVSRRTIYNWMAKGKIQYLRTAGGAIRIFEDSLWNSTR